MSARRLLEPRAGFRWDLVLWHGPKEPVADYCSLGTCEAVFGEGEVPVMMWRDDGSAAQFCEHCQWVWWGIERLS